MGYITFEDFSLKWRFSEEEYNKLPTTDLNKIKPLSISYSKKCWSNWISNKYGHLMKINALPCTDVLHYNDCGWGDPEKECQTVNFLQDNILISKEAIITFFWSESCSVETTWGVFLKYWTDFCYPSDDSNVIIIHDYPLAVIYIEDKLWIVNRAEYFGSC